MFQRPPDRSGTSDDDQQISLLKVYRKVAQIYGSSVIFPCVAMAPPAAVKSAGKTRPKSRERIDVTEDVVEPPVSFPIFDEADITNEKWNVCHKPSPELLNIDDVAGSERTQRQR